MRVTWRTEPLGRKRMPQSHGRVVDAVKAKVAAPVGVHRADALVYLCRHRGEGRVKLRPVLQVRQEATAERGRWVRSYRLPTFRSCCLAERSVREAWWDAVDTLLEQWFEARSLPKGDPFGIRDLWSVRRALARRIPRPASRARRARRCRAQAASAGRKKAALEARARAEAEELQRVRPFQILGLDVQASPYEIKQALGRKKREILGRHGSLAELRQVQAAAEAALARRVAGM